MAGASRRRAGEEKRVCYLREGDFKIIYRDRDESWELYNLKEDPGEQTNIIDTSPVADKMKAHIRERLETRSNN